MPSAPPDLKPRLYDLFARVAKALASPTRMEILDVLAQGERSVEVLAGEAGTTLANVSQHLRTLRHAGLVEARRRGRAVVYRLAEEAVTDTVRALQRLAERRLEEISRVRREFFDQPGRLEPLNPRALLARMRSGAITVVDVRPAEEFGQGHLKGARSIPLADLRRRLGELPRQGEIVAYCRGPYCVLAVQAVELLRRHGFRATRLAHGVREFRAARLPVAAAR